MNDEHTILNYYNLTNPFPIAWPAEKDENDASEEESTASDLSKAAVRRSRSRYSALERNDSDRRSLVPGSQKLRDGHENLVQKDEPDPLGVTDSVIRVLRQKGLPVEEDQPLSEGLPSFYDQTKLKSIQGIGSSCPLPPSLQIYIYHRSIQMLQPSLCCKVLTFFPDQLIRNLRL